MGLGLLKGSWDLASECFRKVLVRIALLRTLMTPINTLLSKSLKPLRRVSGLGLGSCSGVGFGAFAI